MLGNPGDDVLPEKPVLLRTVVGNATIFERFSVNRAEVQLDTVADLDGSTLCDVLRDALVCSSFSVLIDVLELLINLDHVRV